MKKRVTYALIASIVMSAFIVNSVSAKPEPEHVDGTEHTESQAAESMTEVNAQLVDLLVQYEMLQKDLYNQQVQIDTVTADLSVSEERERKQYEDMKLRIKYMYEDGDGTFLEVLLSVKSYAELVNKAEYMQKVHDYDRKKLQEYIKAKEEVAVLKQGLESGRSEMEVLARDYEGQKENLQSILNTMREQMPDFEQQYAMAQSAAAVQVEKLVKEKEKLAQTGGNAAKDKTSGTGGSAAEGTGKMPNGSDGNINNNIPQPNPPETAPVEPEAANPVPAVPDPPAPVPPMEEPADPEPPAVDGSLGESIADTAYSYAGNLDYVYGGTSLISGADCSGFTQAIFRQYGIIIPRTAEDQWNGWGRNVSYSEAMPGDLVCYSGHVGIYIGGGQLVHASNPEDGVKISNIGYRQWLGFKRYW